MNVPALAPRGPGRGPAVIAFDVGGTDIKSAMLTEDGRLVGLNRTPSPERGPSAGVELVDRLELLARDFAERQPAIHPVAIGLGIPGLVDEASGVGRASSNLGWVDSPLRAMAQARLQLPVALGHDVRVAGLAEHRLGAARVYRDVAIVTIGTGVAAALILDGRPYVGGGSAGEIGHLVIDPAGEPCVCGARGCLETIGSAAAIVRRYTARTGLRVGGADEVVARAKRGDPDAQAVWTDALDALAIALTTISVLLTPQAIVIGGGLALAGETLLEPLRERLRTSMRLQPPPDLIPAALGAEAGLIGAALVARDLAATAH